jgi:hypothetical protein
MYKLQTTTSRDGRKMTEPAELTLSGYALLRLSPTRWRSLWRRIAGPAFRLHELRNVRTRMWREALCDLDRPCH